MDPAQTGLALILVFAILLPVFFPPGCCGDEHSAKAPDGSVIVTKRCGCRIVIPPFFSFLSPSLTAEAGGAAQPTLGSRADVEEITLAFGIAGSNGINSTTPSSSSSTSNSDTITDSMGEQMCQHHEKTRHINPNHFQCIAPVMLIIIMVALILMISVDFRIQAERDSEVYALNPLSFHVNRWWRPRWLPSIFGGRAVPESEVHQWHHQHTMHAHNAPKRPLLPLSQYHQRLNLYSMYVFYASRRKQFLRRLQIDVLREQESPTSTAASRLRRRVVLEKVAARTQYALYIQRLYMRARRHSDAMRMETLHFLKYLSTSIPALQEVWKGEDMCAWPGVTCKRISLPFNTLIDPSHPIVRTYLQHRLIEVNAVNSTEDCSATPSNDAWCQQMESQLLSRFFTKNMPSVWLKWIGRRPPAESGPLLKRNVYSGHLASNTGNANAPAGCGGNCAVHEESDFMFRFPEANREPALLYIGDGLLLNSDGVLSTDDVTTAEAVFLKEFYKSAAPQAILVERSIEHIVVPVVVVEVDLKRLDLSGHIPEMRISMHRIVNQYYMREAMDHMGEAVAGYFLRDDPEGDTNDPTRKVYRPRSREYWPDVLVNSATDWPNFVAKLGFKNGMKDATVATLLASSFFNVLVHLEKEGAAQRHPDMANYFSELAKLADLSEDSPDYVAPGEVNTAARLHALGLTLDSIEAQCFRGLLVSPTRNSIDDEAVFGDFESRLVSIVSMDLSMNPRLYGDVPCNWFSAPLFAMMSTEGTSITTCASMLVGKYAHEVEGGARADALVVPVPRPWSPSNMLNLVMPIARHIHIYTDDWIGPYASRKSAVWMAWMMEFVYGAGKDYIADHVKGMLL